GHMGSGPAGAALPMFMLLDTENATPFTGDTLHGFGKFGTGNGGENGGMQVDKGVLQALVEEADQIDTTLYTATTANRLIVALNDARSILSNSAATQSQVDSAESALLGAIDGLILLPTEELQPGETYLINIVPTMSDNSGIVSGLLAPLYYSQAVVEVGVTSNTVTFFHSEHPVIPSPDGDLPAGPTDVFGYRYDPNQSQVRPPAAVMRAAGDILSTEEDVRALTVTWPNLSLPLFMTIDFVPGMPTDFLPAPTFMVLDQSTAQRMTVHPFPEFIDAGDNGQTQTPADKTALVALIAQAEARNLSLYTVITADRVHAALGIARSIAADPSAEQRQVDDARTALQVALNGLMERPTGQLQVGRSYLMNIVPTTQENNGAISQLIAPLYHQQAVVVVNSIGARTSATVTFFHSNTPIISSPGGSFRSPASDVFGYAFDPTQSQVRPHQSVLRSAGEVLNAAGNVRAITVNWPDISRPLFMTIDRVPGMPAELLPAPTFMVLNPATAQHMTQHPFPSLDGGGWQAGLPGSVDKAALQNLVNRASRVRSADFTTVTFNALRTELQNARRVLNDGTVEQRQVNAARTALQRAYDGLVRRSASNAIDINNLQDGRYTVRVDFWNSLHNQASMANGALNSRAIIDVRNGRATMSVATNPLSITGIVTHLGTLQVNGRNATVAQRNLTGGRPSQFSFPLPNRNTWQPVRLWMDPAVEVMPLAGQGISARLRINWDTIQHAGAGARLSGSTAVVTATLAELEDIERTAEETDEVLQEPVLTTEVEAIDAVTGEIDRSDLARGEEADMRNAGIPWYGWTAIGLGIMGAVAGAWLFLKKKALRGKVQSEGPQN
ncbi:MAG: NEAT domain-containing protein, partial [Coriobacteriia bacterium]|nr:NEAT domain-containing protein [Coriobacteriia bacterium]MCL2536761.1 NEAT domain-containing protein [Coriobacteriia bacterium]